MEDEENSKLLSGQPPEEELRPLACLGRDNYDNASTRIDQIDLARARVQLALDEFNSLLKEEQLMHDSEAGKMVNNTSSEDTLSKGKSSGLRKRKGKRGGLDSNNNHGCGSGKSKASRFSSVRRSTLRRPPSSRHIERSASGLSEVDYISRFVFPIAFILFGVVYWIALFYYKLH